MEIFAGFIQAMKEEGGGVSVVTIPFYTTEARTKEGANVLGHRLAREHFPKEEGWIKHTSLAMPVVTLTKTDEAAAADVDISTETEE